MKQKFKDNVMYVVTGTQLDLIEMKEKVINPSKKTKIVMGIVLSLLIIALTISFAFASGDQSSGGAGDIKTKITSAVEKLYGVVVGVSTALMLLCAVVGLVLAMLTTNQQKTARWLDFVKKAALIWVIILMLSTILHFIASTFGDGNGPSEKIPSLNNTKS